MSKVTSILLALLAAAVIVCAVSTGVGRQTPAEPSGGTAQRTSPRTWDLDGLPAPEPAAPASAPNAGIELDSLSHDKMGWGPGREVNSLNQPTSAVEYQNKYESLGGYFVFPEDGNTIYLTFDLGYENGHTAGILDALAAHNAKGTFFITMDYVNEAPEIVERIIREGHTLANHTVKHPSMPEVSDERLREEITGLHDYILEQYGYEMTLFRYPMGEFSEYTLAQINELGYKSIFWSFAYKDWVTDAQPDPAESLRRVTDALHPGAIYLLHAVSSTNEQIMGDFLTNAEQQGYNFGLIDRKLGLVETQPREEGILD